MSPITTQGFQVSERPRIDYLDPRLLTPQYSAIMPAIGQGLQTYGQIQQIRDEAAMRPIRQQLEQIKLQEAQSRLAQYPLDQQLRLAQIAEAQQNAAVPRVIPGNITLAESQVAPEDMPALDEAGNRTGPMGDLLQITEEQLVGPGGVITPRTVTKTLKTAQQRLVEAEKERAQLEATKALATSRTQGKDFESTRLIELYNNAVESGDTEAAGLYKSRIERLNAAPGLIPAGVSYDRRIEQLAADAGITLATAKELATTAEGAAALAKAAVANKAAARSQFMAPVLTNAEKALLRGKPEGATNLASPSDFQARLDAAMAQKPKTGGEEIPVLTVQQAATAKPGIIFIGIDGKKRKKNPDGTVSLIVE